MALVRSFPGGVRHVTGAMAAAGPLFGGDGGRGAVRRGRLRRRRAAAAVLRLPDRRRRPAGGVPPEVADRARRLLRECGSEEFADRERATARLAELGPMARPLLREALHDPDPEIARRAAAVLSDVDRPEEGVCLEASVRLLSARRP